MATTYTTRTIPTTTYTTRTPIQRFGSYLRDVAGNIISDVSGDPFIVYDANGDINLGGTTYTTRIIP